MQNEKSMYERMADFQANYRSPQTGVPGHKIVGVVLMFARLILNHFGAQEMTLKRRDGGTGAWLAKHKSVKFVTMEEPS
mgnify:CR=1 FL=1